MKKIGGKAINSLTYTGIVTLSQYNSGKKVTVAKMHNNGGKPLFDFLADCLAGDFNLAELDRPNKILLLNVDDEQKISMATDTGFVYQLTKPERVLDDIAGIVRFSFVIPQDIFAGATFNAIGLYNNSATLTDASDYAALCMLDQEFFRNIAISSVLVLDWELHISNTSYYT